MYFESKLSYFESILLYFESILLYLESMLLYFETILLYFESAFLYFESILLYFATMLASSCTENQYSKGKEKVVSNVHFINANLRAVGDNTYAYDAFFFQMGDKKPQLYIPRNKKKLLASERIAAPTLVVPWCDFSADTSFGAGG